MERPTPDAVHRRRPIYVSDAWRFNEFVDLESVHRSALCEVVQWRCVHDTPDFERERTLDRFALNLVTSGAFVHNARHESTVMQAGSVVLRAPGSPYSVSHPFGMGDGGTLILLESGEVEAAIAELRPDLAALRAAGREMPPIVVPARARMLVRQAVLASRAAQAPDAESLPLDETALALLEQLLRRDGERGERVPGQRPETSEQHRAWVESAKAVLAQSYARRLTLKEIARRVYCSPFHLSRIFRRQVGMPLHRYLVRVRLSESLDRVLRGDRDLEAVAAETGFSSHSHLTHAFKREFGIPPSAVRDLVGPQRLAPLSTLG